MFDKQIVRGVCRSWGERDDKKPARLLLLGNSLPNRAVPGQANVLRDSGDVSESNLISGSQIELLQFTTKVGYSLY